MAGDGVFVSYCHAQREWVHDRLLPVLRAGGVELVVDSERFVAGRTVVGQMDAAQDGAAKSLLVLSPEYLASAYCRHEMQRAIARDPNFVEGHVLPLVRVACPLPDEIVAGEPLHVELQDDGDAAQWEKLLQWADAELGTDAPAWLRARSELRRSLSRGKSVNLVVGGAGVRWRPLIVQLAADLAAERRRLAVVDLERGSTVPRRGLIGEILAALNGTPVPVPAEPEDLAEFDRQIAGRAKSWLAIEHFDLAARRPQYGVDFFSALRYHLMESRRLVLLVQSRAPFATLLPHDHPLSAIDVQTVELPGR